MRKYFVGMDVHQASTSIALMNGQGKLIRESVIEIGVEISAIAF